MTDALINDKPQFVRLFTENGLNILDYLTYGRLESLYRSVADGTVLYQLLQRRLVERLGTAVPVPPASNLQAKVAEQNMQNGPVNEISLFEVCFSDDASVKKSFVHFVFDRMHLCVSYSGLFFRQVSGVLELLMGDVCQPFYYDALDLEQISSKRRALKVLF